MKNTYTVFALSLAMIFVAGCTEDPVTDGGREPLDGSKYITVTTSVVPMEGDALDSATDYTTNSATGFDSDSADLSTRGIPVSSQAQMTDFALFATYTGGADWTADDGIDLMNNEKMVKSGATEGDRDYWTYASGNPVRWVTGPGTTANDRYTFFAYAPYGAAANGISVIPANVVSSTLGRPAGLPFIRYATPTAVASHPDLMIASRRENIRPTGNLVSLAMHHALTAVGFKVIGNGEAISSIAITGFSDKAIAELNGDDIAWYPNWLAADGSLLSTPAATAPLTPNWFAAGLVTNAAANATGDVMANNGWLMMIPQTLGEDAKVRITFSDGTPEKILALDTRQWQAGRRVTYTINVSIPTIVGVRNIGTDPGVIGYIYNPGKPDHMQLTLAKDDGNDLNGYVYVAYFKFGSLVAMGSQGGGAFTSADVVAWPTDWAATTDFAKDRTAMEAKFAGATAGLQAYDVIPDVLDKYSLGSNITFPSTAYPPDPIMALGDPCDYYFGSGGWKTPLIDELSLLGNDPGYSWSLTGTASATNPGIGVFPQASVTLPAAGYRATTMFSNQGTGGRYWSANAGNGSGYFLSFTNTAPNTNISTGVTATGAIRCMKPVVATNLTVTPASQILGWDAFSRGESVVYDVTADGDWFVTTINSNFTITRTLNGTGYNGTITVTPTSDNTSTAARNFSIIVAAPRATALNRTVTVTQGTRGVRNAGNTPGIIGYYYNPGQPNHMQLTMDTDDGNDANGIVYVAYFKYNSLIAIDSQDSGAFSSADILAWPTEWATTTDYVTDRTAMEAKFAGTTTAAAAFAVFAGTSSMATSDPTPAQGDACTRYFGSGWKVPTQAENTTFFGGMGTVAAGTYVYTAAVTATNRPALGTFPNAPGAPAGSGGYSVPMSGNRTPGITTAIGGHYWVNGSGRPFMTLSSSTADYTTTGTDVAKQIRCQPVF